MSEQHIAQPQPQESPKDIQEVTGWHGVAAEYKTWHKGLHPHVENNLSRLGYSHLIDVSEGNTAQDSVASHTAGSGQEKPGIDDQTREIREALEDANTIHVDALMNSRTLLALTKEKGIDSHNLGQDSPEYWDLLAETTDGYADFRRGKGDSELTVQSLVLICKLPQSLIAVHKLETHGDEQYDLRKRDKEIASMSNARLREFFTSNPETSIKDFKKELSMITGYMFSNIEDRRSMVDQLNNRIRGAMHESAVEDIIEYSGYARNGIREATTDEDLQGIDLVIDPGEWDELCIDVKASKIEIQNLAKEAGIKNWNRPFFPRLGHAAYRDRASGKEVAKRKDVVVMYSLLDDSWFGDRFKLSDQHIKQVAELMPDIIEESKNCLHNMRKKTHRSKDR